MSLNTAPRAASPKKTIVDLTHGTHSYLISIYFFRTQDLFYFLVHQFDFASKTERCTVLNNRMSSAAGTTTSKPSKQRRKRASKSSAESDQPMGRVPR